MFCATCATIHNIDKQHDKDQIHLSVQYDSRHEKISVVCQDHKTFCNYICCGEFVCLYCTHRSHLHHVHTTIKEEAQHVRMFAAENEPSLDDLQTIKERVDLSMDTTKVNVEHWHNTLKSVLRCRKEKFMANYLEQLDRDEKRLMKKFTLLVDKHFEVYPEGVSIEYFREIERKEDIELISKKNEIKRKITKVNSAQAIPTSEINLCGGRYGEGCGLGELNALADTFSPTDEDGYNSLHCNFAHDDHGTVISLCFYSIFLFQ